MKIETIIALSCAVLMLGLNFAEAGTATIYGTVTDIDGKSAPAATPVTVRILNIGPEFPWIAKTAYTDAGGNYYITIDFPDIVQIRFIVEAAPRVIPFKYGTNWVGFYDEPPQNGGAYQINIKLSSYTQHIVVQGYIRDADTGRPLDNAHIHVTSSGVSGTYGFVTDSDGFYRGLVKLGSISTGTINLNSPGIARDVIYVSQQISNLAVQVNKIYTFNFYVKRKEQTGYIFGTVIDANTGRPIPFASVYVYDSVGWPGSSSETDFLGRYKGFLMSSNVETYHVITTGANTQSDRRSPYYTESKYITVEPGQMQQLDFQMHPK